MNDCSAGVRIAVKWDVTAQLRPSDAEMRDPGATPGRAVRDRAGDMKIQRLAENEGEWDTDVVLRIGKKYILRHENGGSRGSHQFNNHFPALLDADEPLTAEEAAAKCLEFGAEESVIESINQ